MANWYVEVVTSLSKIPSCISYYEGQLIEARRDLCMRGKRIDVISGELPGLVEYRFNQLQEVEAILEYLNIQLKKKRSEVFRKFLENYNKALSSRDAEKYTDGDSDVVDLTVLVNEFALLRNKFLGITKGLDQKSFMIGHITRLRCAGLDDAIMS